MINILYFARLRETLGVASENMVLPSDIKTIEELCSLLQKRGGAWLQEFSIPTDIRVAINQEMVSFKASVKEGDEIAFFPPITGG